MGKKKYKVWYYLETAIGYGIYNSVAELERVIPRYIELGFI